MSQYNKRTGETYSYQLPPQNQTSKNHLNSLDSSKHLPSQSSVQSMYKLKTKDFETFQSYKIPNSTSQNIHNFNKNYPKKPIQNHSGSLRDSQQQSTGRFGSERDRNTIYEPKNSQKYNGGRGQGYELANSNVTGYGFNRQQEDARLSFGGPKPHYLGNQKPNKYTRSQKENLYKHPSQHGQTQHSQNVQQDTNWANRSKYQSPVSPNQEYTPTSAQKYTPSQKDYSPQQSSVEREINPHKLSYSKYSVDDLYSKSNKTRVYDDYSDIVAPSPIAQNSQNQFYFSGNSLDSQNYQIKPDQTCQRLDRLLEESATKIRNLSSNKNPNRLELRQLVEQQKICQDIRSVVFNTLACSKTKLEQQQDTISNLQKKIVDLQNQSKNKFDKEYSLKKKREEDKRFQLQEQLLEQQKVYFFQ